MDLGVTDAPALTDNVNKDLPTEIIVGGEGGEMWSRLVAALEPPGRMSGRARYLNQHGYTPCDRLGKTRQKQKARRTFTHSLGRPAMKHFT